MKKRVIIYTRVSTDEQAKFGNSLNDQKIKLENYCNQQGHQVVAHYQDDHSAKSFNRPEFNKMMVFLKKNNKNVDLLLFMRWDRFSRNTEQSYTMISKLESMGIGVQSVEQPLDFSIPEQRIMLAIYLAFPHVENLRRGLNINMGQRRAIKEGRWPFKVPFGYKNIKNESNKTIAVACPKKATVIQEIFEMIAAGNISQREVVVKLKKQGHKINKSYLSLILRNKFYIGVLKLTAFNDEPAKEVKGIHEPLISENLFYKVQTILDGNKKNKNIPSTKRKREELPHRGTVLCSNCGKKLTGSRSSGNGGKYFYYHCNACKQVRFRADVLDKKFEQLLEEIEPSEEVKELYIKILTHELKKGIQHDQNEVSKVKKQIEKLQDRKQVLQDQFMDGKIDSEDFNAMSRRNKLQLLSLEDTLEQLSVLKQDFNDSLLNGTSTALNIKSLYEKADLEGKMKIIGSTFPRKFIFDKNKVRTDAMNEVLLWIMKNSKAFQKTKTGHPIKNDEVSSMVENIGIEPMTF